MFWLEQQPWDQSAPQHHHHSTPDGSWDHQDHFVHKGLAVLAVFTFCQAFRVSGCCVCTCVCACVRVCVCFRLFSHRMRYLLSAGAAAELPRVSPGAALASLGGSVPLFVPELLPLHVSLGVSGSVRPCRACLGLSLPQCPPLPLWHPLGLCRPQSAPGPRAPPCSCPLRHCLPDPWSHFQLPRLGTY